MPGTMPKQPEISCQEGECDVDGFENQQLSRDLKGAT